MEKLKDTNKVRDMVIYQVPDNLRGKIWRSISGNPASISGDYFKMLCIKGERIGKIIMEKAAIEKSGQPAHDSDYLRANMDINMMVISWGVYYYYRKWSSPDIYNNEWVQSKNRGRKEQYFKSEENFESIYCDEAWCWICARDVLSGRILVLGQRRIWHFCAIPQLGYKISDIIVL